MAQAACHANLHAVPGTCQPNAIRTPNLCLNETPVPGSSPLGVLCPAPHVDAAPSLWHTNRIA